jgi:hypothetical protein
VRGKKVTRAISLVLCALLLSGCYTWHSPTTLLDKGAAEHPLDEGNYLVTGVDDSDAEKDKPVTLKVTLDGDLYQITLNGVPDEDNFLATVLTVPLDKPKNWAFEAQGLDCKGSNCTPDGDLIFGVLRQVGAKTFEIKSGGKDEEELATSAGITCDSNGCLFTERDQLMKALSALAKLAGADATLEKQE